jgi:thymidylate synthase (FAD)
MEDAGTGEEMTVKLIEHYGDDLRIVNAARESYDKQSDWLWMCPEHGTPTQRGVFCGQGECSLLGEPGLKPADAGLVGFLMKNRHGTPFEMVDFTFHVECCIGVAREWQRHRIASINERSTRYVEMKPEFYIPKPEHVRTQVGKPGHYRFEPMSPDDANWAIIQMSLYYNDAYAHYQHLLSAGIAKELARNVLPLGLMTGFYFKTNLRSLFNFLALRTAPNALLEIQLEAQAVEEIVKVEVPAAYAAWEKFGKPVGDEFHDCDSTCIEPI